MIGWKAAHVDTDFGQDLPSRAPPNPGQSHDLLDCRLKRAHPLLDLDAELVDLVVEELD